MAKRFIDTGFLDQKWIRKLSPEKKVFVIYLMLKCDNAGVIDLDMEDAEFWIGKKIGNPLKFLPQDFLIQIVCDPEKYFIPKYIQWQYPNFPNSKNYLQKQAVDILIKYQLFDVEHNKLVNNYPTVTQTLGNCKVTVNVDVDVKDNVDVKKGAERVEIVFPFDSEEFKNWWDLWKEYKSKEHKFKYKSHISEQAALKKVSALSGGNEDIAFQILEQSMANGWEGLFELKDSVKQSPVNRAAQRDIAGRKFAEMYNQKN